MTPAKLAQAHATARAPVSPAAWLDRMAADAGHEHVQRLLELRGELARLLPLVAGAGPSVVLSQLAAALPQLDYSLLEPKGWWARTRGKGRTAAAEFVARAEQIDGLAVTLDHELQSLDSPRTADDARAERTLLELEVECGALDNIIDQGARWLQDMRNQIKARHAQATDAAAQQQVSDDAARCEILVARLKALRSTATAARSVQQQAQAAAAQRADLAQGAHKALSGGLRTWRMRQSTLMAAGQDDRGRRVDGPLAAHQALLQCVQRALSEGARLQAQEQALAGALAALDGQLAATR